MIGVVCHPPTLYNELTFQFKSIPTFGAAFAFTQTHNMNPRFFILLSSLFMSQLLCAQSTAPAAVPSDPEIRKATELLTTKYSLNADQAKQVYHIQLRKHRNMAEIAALQATDIDLYHAKCQNIQTGTWASIRRMLNSKEQVEIYKKTQAEIRTLRNAKRKELYAQKAGKDAVDAAVLAIYAE
jgi:hypothetical protein